MLSYYIWENCLWPDPEHPVCRSQRQISSSILLILLLCCLSSVSQDAFLLSWLSLPTTVPLLHHALGTWHVRQTLRPTDSELRENWQAGGSAAEITEHLRVQSSVCYTEEEPKNNNKTQRDQISRNLITEFWPECASLSERISHAATTKCRRQFQPRCVQFFIPVLDAGSSRSRCWVGSWEERSCGQLPCSNVHTGHKKGSLASWFWWVPHLMSSAELNYTLETHPQSLSQLG